jgi:hypothetical protein
VAQKDARYELTIDLQRQYNIGKKGIMWQTITGGKTSVRRFKPESRWEFVK